MSHNRTMLGHSVIDIQLTSLLSGLVEPAHISARETEGSYLLFVRKELHVNVMWRQRLSRAAAGSKFRGTTLLSLAGDSMPYHTVIAKPAC